MKRYCECGKRVVVIRRITKRGRFQGRIKVFADRRHSLCVRHHNSLSESLYQERKFLFFKQQVLGGRITDLKLHPSGLTESLFSALQRF